MFRRVPRNDLWGGGHATLFAYLQADNVLLPTFPGLPSGARTFRTGGGRHDPRDLPLGTRLAVLGVDSDQILTLTLIVD